MLNNFRNLQSLLWSHGSRWLMFRLGYAFRKQAGFIRVQMPVYAWKDRPLESWLKSGIPSTPDGYASWRRQNSPAFFLSPLQPDGNDSRPHAAKGQLFDPPPWDTNSAVDEAERVLSGDLKYFAHRFIQTGFPPDWHRDPHSGIRLDRNKHWSEISDQGDADIKFIWEASRFGMVYPLVRACASAREEKYAEAFWTLIESWAESNPPNAGPNWMDGQEVALRTMAWTFGCYAFLESPSTTHERIARFTVLVAAHAQRIYQNIDYAISTHSNHTISEAFGLWMVGLLFPELRDAEKYESLGRKLLEQEAAAQMLPDGGYSMYSLNYHRFVLQIYLLALRLGELNGSPLSDLVFDRVAASIDLLSHLVDPETGQMPLYGSNDGALVLPLNNCDFTDYRPLLQLGSYVTRKQFLFQAGPWDEDVFWLSGGQALDRTGQVERIDRIRSGLRQKGPDSYPHAGIYILRSSNSHAIIRCTDWRRARSRPSHADQLHVDLWLSGKNIACDAGTYLYSGEGMWRNGLAHTSVHNTVSVDHQDQMKMLSRFTWTNWSTGRVLRQDEKTWQGEHDGYRRLADPVSHKRTVVSLGEDRWLVVDHLDANRAHHYSLHWLLNDFAYERYGNSILLSVDSLKYKMQVGLLGGKSDFSVVRGDPHSMRGWRSRYYADKEPAISAMLETDQAHVCFWTFFGFELDAVESSGTTLHFHSGDWNAKVDLRASVP